MLIVKFFPWGLFFILSAIILISAWCVVSLRNIIHCALYLCLCLVAIAGLYILLAAEFIAAVQILIYAGGITVLLLFAILLTQKIEGVGLVQANEQRFFSFLISVTFFAFLSTILLKIEFKPSIKSIALSTPVIGDLLLTKYVLGFEIASILLLVAMIGAIIFIRK